MEDNTEKLTALVAAFKLGNSQFKEQTEISTIEIARFRGDASYIIDRKRDEMCTRLGRNILRTQPRIYKEYVHENGNTILEVDLLAFPLEDYKFIVEAAIQMMPMDTILKIRGEK